jgi:hypothetical protein
LRLSCPARLAILGAVDATTVCLSKPFCGLRVWRDLPETFGKWFSVYTRFWRWAKKGVWERVFKALSDDPDFEYVLIDGTLVRVHQHETGAKGGLKIRP